MDKAKAYIAFVRDRLDAIEQELDGEGCSVLEGLLEIQKSTDVLVEWWYDGDPGTPRPIWDGKAVAGGTFERGE